MTGMWFYTRRWYGDRSKPRWHDDKDGVCVNVGGVRRMLSTLRIFRANLAVTDDGWIEGDPFHCRHCKKPLGASK